MLEHAADFLHVNMNMNMNLNLNPLPKTAASPIPTAAEFEACLLHFVNETLPRMDRRGKAWPPVSAATPLFAPGLLDSLSILHLISALEELTGHRIPDDLVLMKHFQTIQSMTATFCTPQKAP